MPGLWASTGAGHGQTTSKDGHGRTTSGAGRCKMASEAAKGGHLASDSDAIGFGDAVRRVSETLKVGERGAGSLYRGDAAPRPKQLTYSRVTGHASPHQPATC